MTSSQNADVLYRFSRRSLVAVLFITLILGTTALAMMLSPRGAVVTGLSAAGWALPVIIVIVVAALRSSLQKRRWDPQSPEVKAILEDEWRTTNMQRAQRCALVVVLVAQWPLAMLIGFVLAIPPDRTAMAMATSSVTLGLTTLIALFLYFDRE